jgi:hypothetical protein
MKGQCATQQRSASAYCPLVGQGAIEKPSAASAGALVGQGATEYLVLLAVVLVVALVSVALLGFFPGMASDAQMTQSKAYWQSASPVSIVEMDAVASASWGSSYSWPYLRIRNIGAYPIRLTKILGGAGQSITVVYCSAAVCGSAGYANISDWYYLAPGEEKHFCSNTNGCTPAFIHFVFNPIGSSYSNSLAAFSSGCQNATDSQGVLVVNNFGFEYIEYIEGQQITKRQIGAKPLAIKCSRLVG